MDELLDYLYDLKRFGMKLGLEEISEVLEGLDNPQDKFKSIHLAGTNGKGSTAAFIAKILEKASYKVGLYTSPHLVKFNERIKINGVDISDFEIVELVRRVKKEVEEKEIEITFFEFTTAMAFLHFAEKEVDFAVVETGLGGRLDATNVLNPEVSVITSIGLDHQKLLGNSLFEIAREKAGIIKEGSKVVVGEKDEGLVEIFKEYSDDCYLVGDFAVLESDLSGQKFIFNNNKYNLSLLGKHQIDNACNALLTIDVLNKKGYKIPQESIKQGLKDTKWPGRLEIISKDPLVIVDGAHNVQGMERLAEFVKGIEKRKLLILAFSEDKDVSTMVKLIVPLFDKVIITQGNFKPMNTKIVADEVKKHVSDVQEIPDVKEVMKQVEDGTLITGSLYMVGDVLKQSSQERED